MELESLKATLATDPLNADALEKLNAAYVDSANLDALAELHEHIFAHADEQSAPEALLRALDLKARTTKNEVVAAYLYARLGLLFWKKLGNTDKAELYFRRVDAGDPEFAEAYEEFYTDFYARRGNWRRLEQFLAEKAGDPQDPEGLSALRRRLARLAADAGSPEKAVSFWSGVLEVADGDTEAEEALLALYAKVKKWHSLIELLQRRLDRFPAKAADEKIALYLEMIRVYRDEIRSDTKVNSTYQAILELDPGNMMALDALEAQFEGQKRWPDLVRVLQQKIEHATDPAALVSLHQRVADIMMERFSNSAEALKSYQAILELMPGDRATMAKLKELYEKRRDYESYLDIARQEVAFEEDDAVRGQKLLELAKFASANTRKPASAIALWEDVLALDPSSAEALEALEGLYEREKNYELLASTIDRRVEVTADSKAKVALLEKLGLVVASRLEDQERSVDVYRRVLEIQPDNRKAQNELRKHYLNTKDWDRLEWFFREYGTVAELVRTLDAQAKSSEDPSEQAALLVRCADLALTDLGQPDKAIKSLEKLLETESGQLLAARRLAPLYREAGAYKGLVEVIEVQLRNEEDAAIRRGLQLDLATLYEEKLGDSDRAFFAFVQVYKESSDDAASQAQLERLAERSGNWDTYAAVLEETLPRIDVPAVRAVAELRAAEVYRDHIGDRKQALRHFQMAVAFDPTNRPAIDAIEQLYVQSGDWRLLVELYKRKRELAVDSAEERNILFSLGEVWRDRLDNIGEATKVFQELIGRFPDDVPAHRELAALYLVEGDDENLLEVLQRELGLLESDFTVAPSDIAELRCLVAQLTYATGGDLHDVVHHYRAALEAEPTSTQAVEGLEALISSEEVQREVTETLEAVYRTRSQWDKLADVMEIQLREELPHSHKVAVLRMLGELYRDSLSDETRAFRSFARIFDTDPGELGVREALEPLAASLGAWADLASLYEAHVDEIVDLAVQAQVRLTLARTFEEQLGDADNAQLHYEALLQTDPIHTQALDALERIYARTSQWESLLGIYRRKLEVAPADADRIALLSRIEQVWSEQLGDLDEGIAAASEILVVDGDNAYAWRRLEDLYGRAERWDDLAYALRQRGRLASTQGERLELLHRLADVMEHRLEDLEGSLEVRRETLTLAPDYAETLAALERLFDARTLAPEVGGLLEAHYVRQDNWNRLIEVYEVKKEAAHHTSEKVGYDFRIAQLYEDKGLDAETAFLYYGFAYAAQPEAEQALSNLLRLAEVVENWGELVHLLQAHVDDIGDPARRQLTHRTIAQVAEKHLGAYYDIAKRHYEAIVDQDPADVAALEALLALHRRAEKWPAVVEALQGKADRAEDASARTALLKEAAEISASRLGKRKDAIALYDQALGFAPADAEILDALEMLYEAESDWESLVAILARKAEVAQSLPERKALAFRRAEVFEQQLEALDDAVEALRTVLGWDDADVQALRRLDALFAAKEDWLDCVDNLKRLQPLVAEAEQLAIQYRLGRIWEVELGDVYQAIDAYRALLERDPSHVEGISALDNLVRTSDERGRAFEVLLPVLEVLDEWERLVDLHEVVVAHTDEPEARIRLLGRIAEVAEAKLRDPSRAFDGHARAFQADPSRSESVLELERLAAEQGYWEELQALYREGAAEVGDPMQSARYLRRVGEILQHELGDAPRAIAVYEGIVEDMPDDDGALRALDVLYGETRAWKKLGDVLRTRIDATADVGPKVELMFRLAALQFEKLDQPSEAFDTYQEVLYLQAGNQQAIDQLRFLGEAGVRRLEAADLLEPIYRERQAWADLDAVLRMRLEETTDAIERVDLFRQLAELAMSQRNAPVEAMRWLGEAFVLDPEDGLLLDSLDELSQLEEQPALFADIVLRGAEATKDKERRVELWHRAAAVKRDRLGDRAGAETLLLKVLDIDAEDQAALLALDNLYAEASRWADLESVLVRRVKTADYEDEQARIWSRLGALYRDELDQWDKAVAAFRSWLKLEESSEPALRALAQLHEARAEWMDLYSVQRQLAMLVQDDAERLSLLEGLAKLAEEKLDDIKEATSLWEEVLVADPVRRPALNQLQRLLEVQNKHEDLADALRRELDLPDGAETRVLSLHRQLGRLWKTTLDDALQSQPHWEAVRAADPTDIEALVALRAIYQDSGSVEPLESVLEDLIELGGTSELLPLGLWVELAELRQNVLGKPAQAMVAWEAVVGLETTHEEALDQLERLYLDAGQWADVARTLERKLALAVMAGAEEDAIDLQLRVAEIQISQLDQRDAAAETLRGLLQRHPDHLDASAKLERIYEESGKFDSLSDLLINRIDVLEEASDRIFVLHKLARVHEEKLSDITSAFLFHVRALDFDADERHSLAELDRLAGPTEMWGDYAGTVEQATSRMEDPLLKVDTLYRLGVVVRDELDRPEDAVRHFQAALAIQSDHEPALVALAELHTLLEDWAALIEVLDGLTEVAADYRERVRAAVRIGEVYERQMGNADRAVDAYRRVLDLDESEPAALQALDALYTQRQNWKALVDILDLRARANPAEEVALKLRAAKVYGEKLGKQDEAIEIYESILATEPANEAALEALQALYAANNDWEGLVAVYDRLLLSTDDDGERKTLHRNIAMVCEEALGDPLRAADAHRDVLAIDPMDLDALENLERIFEAARQWEDLVQILERHSEVVSSDAERVPLWTRMAGVYRTQIGDLDSAIRTFERVLDAQPTSREALDSLESLYGEAGDWNRVIDVLDRKLDGARDLDRTMLRCQKAEIFAERLLSTEQATAELDRAIDEAPDSLLPVQALQKVYAATDNWDKVIDALLREEELHTEPALKAAVLVRVGEIYRDQLLDSDAAASNLERALELVPDSMDAALPLSELHIKAERWAKADPLLRLMAERVETEEDPAEAARLFSLIARSKQNLLEEQEALDYYERALDRAPDHIPSLEGLAELAHKRGRLADAERALTRLVGLIRESAPVDKLVSYFKLLGDIALSQGEDKRAAEYLDEVLALQPGNAEAIASLVELSKEQGNWSAVVRYLREMVPLKSDPLEKLALQLEIGDLCKDRLGNVKEAALAWREALVTDPGAKGALVKLLELAMGRGDNEESVELIEKLIKAEEDSANRSTYALMLAVLYRDELKDEDAALKWLEKSLDFDPMKLEAFRAEDEIFTRRKDWEGEQRAYRRQIGRISGKGQEVLEYKLYRALGEIYRTRLRNFENAISAFELAAQRQPQEPATYEILAELYELNQENLPKCIQAHRALINLEPQSRVGSYRSLYRLYREAGDHDAAWCVASVLTGLGQADDEVKAFYEHHSDVAMAEVSRPLDGNLWARRLLANAQDAVLGEAFQILFETLGGELRAKTLKDLDLKKKDEVNLGDGSMFSNTLRNVIKALNVSEPKVYVSERQLGVRIENLAPPALIVGKDMFSGRSETELAFLLGKVMTYFLPSHIMAAIYQQADLKTILMAAMKVSVPNFPVREDATMAAIAGELEQKLTQVQRQRLADRLLKVKEGQVNLGNWINNIELTAGHAGALLAGDFKVAMGALRNESFWLSKLPPKDKAKDLVLFAISDRYLRLRREVGIAIPSEAAPVADLAPAQ